MSLEVVQNTIPVGLEKWKAKLKTKGELAIRRGMEVARSAIVPGVPVVTSRLKNSIEDSSNTDSINKLETESDEVVGTLGTKVPYALRIEFGFVGQDKLGRQYDQKGRFFFTTGFKSAREDIRRTIVNTLKSD